MRRHLFWHNGFVAALGLAAVCCAPSLAAAQGYQRGVQNPAGERGETRTPARYYGRTTRAGFVWLGAIIAPTETTWEFQVAQQNDRLPRLSLKRNRPVMNTWEDMNWSPNNDFSGRWPREAYWW